MHRQTKATAIPAAVKADVALRDCSGGQISTCIICGAPGAPVAHVVRRSQGGRGDTEKNIVTLCGKCHYSLDEGLYIKGRLEKLGLHTQQEVKEYVYDYMRGHYPDWTPEIVKYYKWGGHNGD